MRSFVQSTPAIVLDYGHCYTKVGFSGEVEPQDVIENIAAKHRSVFKDLDSMESLLHDCIYGRLKCNPEDHFSLLSEPPMNSPDNRDEVAEIMFETFNVPGLFIGNQAILSLAASWTTRSSGDFDLTGTVIDIGETMTYIVPIVNGHVINSSIQKLSVGGRDITSFVQELMRERKEKVPQVFASEVAKMAKEKYAYTCSDLEKEFSKFDKNPEKFIRHFSFVGTKSSHAHSGTVSFERFLAPEVILNPNIYDSGLKQTLAQLVNEAILKCPIDARRKLYANIVLSGGSTMFKDFGRRLQKDIQTIVDSRLDKNRRIVKDASTNRNNYVAVKVVNYHSQMYSAWFGGSLLASSDKFHEMCQTREHYMENGPAVALRGWTDE